MTHGSNIKTAVGIKSLAHLVGFLVTFFVAVHHVNAGEAYTYIIWGDNLSDAKQLASQQCAAEGDAAAGGDMGSVCPSDFLEGSWVSSHLRYETAQTIHGDGTVSNWIWSATDEETCSSIEGYTTVRNCSEHHYVGMHPGNCPSGTEYNAGNEDCIEELPLEKDNGDCCDRAVGNPINFATGNKYQREVDYQGSGPFPLEYVRHFNIRGKWTSFFRLSESVETKITYVYQCLLGRQCRYYTDSEIDFEIASVWRPDGSLVQFKRNVGASIWNSDPDISAVLEETGGSFVYHEDDDSVITFDSLGRVGSITSREGITQTYTYPTDQIVITHEFGRTLTFNLDGQGRVIQLVDSAGEEYNYSYDSTGNLSYVTYPNGDRRDYSYAGDNINAVFDNQIDYVSLWYYSGDIAYQTVKNGNVDRYFIDFSELENNFDPRVTVTGPLGKQTVYHLEKIFGINKLVNAERLVSSTSPSAQMYHEYDANGYLASTTDWEGNTTLYVHDERGLELSRTEAAGTLDERTITTTWDTNFRLPLQINEPGLTRTYTYDANGNMLSETLTDTNTNEVRTTAYTYNTYGQVLTIDGPRTDVSDVTTYTYDLQGNLSSMTNALNQTTQFTSYDAHGNLLLMTDPNGVITQFTYEERQRLTSITRAYGTALAATTSFTYDYAGNIKRVTQPNGAYIEYTYDKAYRVTSIRDNLNNRISYQLDAAGNILSESVYDPANALKRTQTAIFDDLSRMLESTGAASQTYSYAYDDQGNTVSNTDARLYDTSFSFDALNRLVSQTNPEFDTASFAYDDQDRLTSVTDERGLTTTYSYNGFGDLVSQSSPDTGVRTYDYDAAGNLVEQVDARGETVQYLYDALNRMTAASYLSDSSLNESYSYDSGANGVGQMTGFTDFSGATSFSYDQLGRIVSDTRTIYGVSKTTTYDYDLAGNITEIGYPSGATVVYSRDALGRISGVDIDQSPAGSMLPLTSGVGYLPFGGVTGFTYGNGLVFSRQHDQDYRITNQTVSGSGLYEAVDYSYDANSNITDMDDLDDFTRSQLFQYDSLNRLYNEESDFYGEKTYTYDEVGNRTLRTLSAPGEATTNQTHTIDSGSNQLLSRGPRDYSYDAAGNTLAFDEPDGSPRREWVYNAQNRMEELSVFYELKARYQYNGLGQRVMKTLYQDNGSGPEEFQVFVFYYDQQGRLIQNSIYRPNTPVGVRHMRDRQFIWMDDMPVGYLETVYRVNGSVLTEDLHYITADHLNAPAFATNQSGVMSWKWDRDAFGLGELDLDPDGDGVNVNIRLRFPGQYDDEESITFYNYFRDYDPTTGRYMQSDPIGLSGGINTFTYANSDPMAYVDPTGLKSRCIPWFSEKTDWVASSYVSWEREGVIGHTFGPSIGFCEWKRFGKQRQSRNVASRKLCFNCPDCGAGSCKLEITETGTRREERTETVRQIATSPMRTFMNRYQEWMRCTSPWNPNISAEGPMR